MLVRELIQDILDEIGQLVGGNPASDSDAAKCRRLINKCVRDYNVQGFLHFTKSRVPLGQGKVFMFEDKVPLTVNNVYYKVGPEWYSLDPVRPETLPAYEGCGTIPYKFCYEKYFEGNDLKGRVTLDRTSGYDIEAVVTYDMEPFNDNDVLTLPPEFINLLTADVQYRWVSNLAINDTLKRDKKDEVDRLLEFVKGIETKALDVPKRYPNMDDKFYNGVGGFKMAARTVQINSFCGGSSKLADSEFLGMEESINVYPETVTATDSYTTKMLKSVEGFSGTSFSGEKIIGITSVNNTPWDASSVREALLVVTRNNDSSVNHVYAVYGGTKTEVGTFSGVYGDKAVVQELSNGIALVLTYGHLYSANPSSTASPAPTCAAVTLPDAFDHAGEIYPTQMAFLNFRVILNDAEHDYIYWSEINRPTDALDTGAFEQSLTQYAYTKTDGTVVTFDDNVFYAPAVGTYDPDTLTTQVVSTSALNSMKMDFKADKVVAMRATDSSLFVFGQNSLQILRWQNSTTAPFAIVAKTSQAGVMFADAVAVIGSECFYVGKGPQGALGVYAVDENGNIRKISSNAVDQRLARMPSGLGEVKAFAYAYKGHTFFVFKASSFYGELAETMAFDIGEEVWGDRVSFDANGNRCAWTAVDSCTIEGKPYFATMTKGGLWRVSTFNPVKFTDQYLNENPLVDGTNPLVRERTTGIKFDGINDIVVTALELVMNAGETTQTDPSKNGYNPRVMLQVSTDGGRTWSSELWAFAGKVGQYSWRVRWNGLGRGARFAFRVRMTDPVAFEIATAYLSYLPCGNRV